MTFKMSDTDQTIRVFNLAADTGEFIGAGDAYIPAGTGLPAFCTDINPPEAPENQVAVFDSRLNVWSVMEDHRGLTVYDTETGAPTMIHQLGALPAGVATIAPDGQFVKWNGKKWVADKDAEKASQRTAAERQKAEGLSAATAAIAPLQDAVDLDIATDGEAALLVALKKYRVLLNRVDTSLAPDIEWPELPAGL